MAKQPSRSARTADSAPPPTRRPRHNLPTQLTIFIGREWEIVDITRLLDTTRLLILTGSGGCGKTRLAIQVASRLLTRYPRSQ